MVVTSMASQIDGFFGGKKAWNFLPNTLSLAANFLFDRSS